MQKENAEKVKVILAIVRKVTKAIKIFPFLYTILFLITSPIIAFSEFDIAQDVSGLIYMSFVMFLFLIYLSYSVKLCFWHRLQCILPLFPQIIVFIDANFYEFEESLMTIDFVVDIIIFLLSLINAYFVFIRPQSSRP